MVELTHKDGDKVLAYWSDAYKSYVDLQGWPLDSEQFVWVESV